MTKEITNWKKIEKEFKDKFLGECPAYHDSQTHTNYPSEWKEKLLNIKYLYDFFRHQFQKLIEESEPKITVEIEGAEAMKYYKLGLEDGIKAYKSNLLKRIK